MGESRRYLLVFPLGVTERHHIARHAFVAVWIIAALHFPGTKGASVVVNGDIGPVCTGIYTNLFCFYGWRVAKRQVVIRGFSRMPFQSFCIWRRPMPMPESFALAVAGAAKRTAITSNPQALIVLPWLDMGASRRLWTGCYAYSLVCPHGQLLVVQRREGGYHDQQSQMFN
jgi:hypothetical protein